MQMTVERKRKKPGVIAAEATGTAEALIINSTIHATVLSGIRIPVVISFKDIKSLEHWLDYYQEMKTKRED